jgi:hypothetical protein
MKNSAHGELVEPCVLSGSVVNPILFEQDVDCVNIAPRFMPPTKADQAWLRWSVGKESFVFPRD